MSIPVAKEGWPFIAGCVTLALVGTWFCPWPIGHAPLWLLTIWCIWFFRDPERIIPTTEGVVVAPADGRIIAIEEQTAPLSGLPSRKISIFMNVFNVHVNRIPATGEIIKLSYHKGRFFNAALDKASLENERMELLLRTEQGVSITFSQVAGLIARRIVCRLSLGSHVQRGERFGLIRFGSRVDIYLPLSAPLQVVLGDRTTAGETILATLDGA